jgi:hypothetical protein
MVPSRIATWVGFYYYHLKKIISIMLMLAGESSVMTEAVEVDDYADCNCAG